MPYDPYFSSSSTMTSVCRFVMMLVEPTSSFKDIEGNDSTVWHGCQVQIAHLLFFFLFTSTIHQQTWQRLGR
jgi:hypothetical protein